MNYQVITLFPELFEGFTKSTLISRAIEQNLISLRTLFFRQFAINTQGQVDDSPYGGGGGMVARIEASVSAVEKAKENNPNAKVLLFTPRGRPLTQEFVKQLNTEAREASADSPGFILYCSRYEGVDERFVRGWVDHEISVGDAIYMGGEVPAMAFIEASSRLLPGVLGNEDSIAEESFEMGGIEYPQYTKPREFRGLSVPDVLLSGNHAEIAAWRMQKSVVDTSLRRPDLLSKVSLEERTRKKDAPSVCPPVYVGLLHHPVIDKQGKIITSSITNLDVHDIARSVKTFNLDGYFVVHPSRILRTLIGRVCDHWSSQVGIEYNPNRSEALSTIHAEASIDDAIHTIENIHGKLPRIVITSARPVPRSIQYSDFRKILPAIEEPIFILFGTGWGLHQSILDRADYRLNPIWGPREYNHLSVRAAAAIILDRLFGS